MNGILVTTDALGSPEQLAAALPGERLITGPEALARGADAEIALTFGKPDEARAVVAAAPRLRWLHSFLTGIDGLLAADLPLELIVTNGSGSGALPIAEHALALMFSAAKHLRALSAAQDRGEYVRADVSRELRGATAVVLGLGAIGGEVARLAEAIGMRVIGVRRTPGADALSPDRLAEVLPGADYLIVCAPLTAETRGLVGRGLLALLPAHAWVINVSRAAVVDERALLDACREGQIGGAALDVWWTEPLPAESPWWHLPNVIVTPHRSHSSPHGRRRSLEIIVDNLRRFRRGEPLRNVVDLRLGY